MTLMQKLRAHSQKVTWFIMIPVVIAFTLFGLGVSLDSIVGSEDVDKLYEIQGKTVTKAFYNTTRRIWGATARQTYSEEDVKKIVGSIVLARKYGFDVTDAEIDVSISQQFSGSEGSYAATLQQLKISGKDMRLWFEQKLLREKYENFRSSHLVPAASAVYKSFLEQRTNYIIKYALIEPKDFAEDVVINDEKLKELYEKASEKNIEILDKRAKMMKLSHQLDKDEKAIEKLGKEIEDLDGDDLIRKCDIAKGPFADVRFIYVPYKDVKKDIKIEDDSEDVTNYYYDNISKYRKEDLPLPPIYGPFPSEVELIEPETQIPAIIAPADESKPADETKPEEVKPEEDKKPDAAENKTPEPADNDELPDAVEKKTPEPFVYESEFKTIDKVRQEVTTDLIDKKAKLKTDEILTEVSTLIQEMNMVKFDFSIIDPILKENLGEKFPFVMEEKEITPQTAEMLDVFGSTELKLNAFGENSYWTHFDEDKLDKFSAVMTIPTGKYIFFVKNEKKGVIRPFEDVRATVENCYRYIEQKKLAKEYAENIITALTKGGKKIEDLGPTITWKDESGSKAQLTHLEEFKDDGITEGSVCTITHWIDDGRITSWRIQILFKVNEPTLSTFAKGFRGYNVNALSDMKGTNPAEPKGILGAWNRYDEKAYEIKDEEEEDEKEEE